MRTALISDSSRNFILRYCSFYPILICFAIIFGFGFGGYFFIRLRQINTEEAIPIPSQKLMHPLQMEVLKNQKHLKQYVPENNLKPTKDKKVVCYYNVPSSTNSSIDLLPSAIEPNLCSHINIAFASIVNKSISVDEKFLETSRQLQNLKERNPSLKLLVSVGGAGANGFSEMVVDHISRKIFIKSIKYFLRDNKLDGIDLDWEFPVVHFIGNNLKFSNYSKRERQHFSQLLREIRVEFIREKRDYLLTVAVASPQPIVDAAYDIEEINKYVDFVNIMTYDFHFYSKITPFTGLNSPLYSRSSEKFYLARLNINYTIHLYASKGLDHSKMVVGIPTYGHTFRLVNPGNGAIGSPATGFGSVGSFGSINYPDLCKYLKVHKVATIHIEEEAKVPYAHCGFDWISYDDTKSVLQKAMFIKEYALAGAMIYSLNADDYLGICSDSGDSQAFPLSQAIRNTLMGLGL